MIEQTKEQRMYYRIRNLCGLLGMILPWLALFSAGIADHPNDQWWWSISATYYLSPALVGVLVPSSIVLISYIGYDDYDAWITSLSGIFGLCIVLFPCKVSWIPEGTPVGFFQIPIQISHIIHTCSAALFFLLISINSLLLFTKHGAVQTPQKKIRNIIYKVCGWGMIGLLIVFLSLHLIGVPKFFVMIIEILLLSLFGLSWLVKGGAFPFLNDKEDDDNDVPVLIER